MYASEIRWFIRCDTCPDDDMSTTAALYRDKDDAADVARVDEWEIRDDLHRCPDCVAENRTRRTS